jgi:hypothetical protein
MGRVTFDISMSLDGYVTAAGRTPEEPMGPGGTRMFDDSLDDHIDLEPVEVIETPPAIHQRFRVVNRGTA